MKLNWKWRKHYLKMAWGGFTGAFIFGFEDLWMAIKGHNPEITPDPTLHIGKFEETYEIRPMEIDDD